MQIKLWGVRGSIPAPLSNDEYQVKITQILEHAIDYGLKNKEEINAFTRTLPEELRYTYGGNTTCASVKSTSTGKIYIIDCGTGVRKLGYELMTGACGEGKGEIDIFLTHSHWDHIQGIPFFIPIYVPGNIINIYSPYNDQEEYLNKQMISPYFPIQFRDTPCVKNYHILPIKDRKPFQLEENLTVEYIPLKHPGGSFAYKFTEGNKSFIFATDAEFTGESLEILKEETNNFFKNTDLLIIDSQYTLDESFKKFDWGHTSYTMAVNCGIRWNVKYLVLTHHEPAYEDGKLKENLEAAIEHRNQSNHEKPKIFMAREGLTFNL